MARIDDGHSTTISFGTGPSGTGPGITMWEKEVTPPGMDGGGENDTSTMRNTLYRTKSPKSLISLTEMSITVSYDTDIYNDVIEMINTNQEITITFPDTSTLVFWGWLDKFTPAAVVEGEQPTAEIAIVCSNQDADGDEIAPVLTPA